MKYSLQRLYHSETSGTLLKLALDIGKDIKEALVTSDKLSTIVSSYKVLLKDRLLNYHTQQDNTSKASVADTTDFRDVDRKTNKYLSKLWLKLTEIKFCPLLLACNP